MPKVVLVYHDSLISFSLNVCTLRADFISACRVLSSLQQGKLSLPKGLYVNRKDFD